jgi:hypothetical protein
LIVWINLQGIFALVSATTVTFCTQLGGRGQKEYAPQAGFIKAGF